MIDKIIHPDWAFQLEMVFRLLLAGILGGVIGLDRAYRAKDAGLRTHFLVAIGSALMMIVSQYGFEFFDQYAVAKGLTFRLDPSRVAAQIVSGIGFLGAGMIIFQKRVLSGLTTAAGLWTATGIGMAVGGGLYIIGVAATIFTLVGLEMLDLHGNRLVELANFRLSCHLSDREAVRNIMSELHRKNIRVVHCSTREAKNHLIIHMMLRGNARSLNENIILGIFSNVGNLKIQKEE